MERGFTIVEILITLVVMVILLLLGTISVSSLLRDARDVERAEDTAAIARGFEHRYKKGNTYSTDPRKGVGSYPSVAEFKHITGLSVVSGFSPNQVSGGYLTDILIGTNDSTFSNPKNQNQFILECDTSCGAAGNTTRITNLLNANDAYVYSPEDSSGNVCMINPCVRFTLYWKSEVSGQTLSLKSKYRS